MTKRISFCLYIKKDPTMTTEALMLNCSQEASHIYRHVQKFTEEARQSDDSVPGFYIHLLFLEQSRIDTGVTHCKDLDLMQSIYELFQMSVVNRMRDAEVNIQILDFALTRRELRYFRDNFNGGDIIDLMKLRVLFEPYANNKPHEYVDHLQLDTNVIITDYPALYALTFRRGEPQFFINIYSHTKPIFTVNNKAIFLPAGAPLFIVLLEKYQHFMREHQDASSSELFMYKHVFLIALQDISVLNTSGFINFNAPMNESFLITSVIAGRVLQTWSNNKSRLGSSLDQSDIEKFTFRMPSSKGQRDELELDYYAFHNYLRKHSTCLLGANTNTLRKHMALFKKYSNVNVELDYMRAFIRAAIHYNPSFTPALAEMITNLGRGHESDAHGHLATVLKSNLEGAFEPLGPESLILDRTDDKSEKPSSDTADAELRRTSEAALEKKSMSCGGSATLASGRQMAVSRTLVLKKDPRNRFFRADDKKATNENSSVHPSSATGPV